MTRNRVAKVVGKIGLAAKILVDPKHKKYASAHDLRRSFGERWASLVMPTVLVELMRHESIETTLKYYVGQNAERTTKVVKEAYEKIQKAKAPVVEASKNESRDTLRDTSEKPVNLDAEGQHKSP